GGAEESLAVIARLQRADASRPGDVGQRALQVRRQLRLLRRRHLALVDDDRQRTVGTRPEAFADQIEGSSVGEAFRVGAVADMPEPDGEQRDRQDPQDDQAGDEEIPGPPLALAGVVVPHAGRFRPTGSTLGDQLAYLEPVDASAE